MLRRRNPMYQHERIRTTTPLNKCFEPCAFFFHLTGGLIPGPARGTPPPRYAGSISGIAAITPLSMGNATVTENVTLIRLKPNNGNDSNHSVTLTVTLNNRRGDIGSIRRGSHNGREGEPRPTGRGVVHDRLRPRRRHVKCVVQKNLRLASPAVLRRV